MNHEQAAWYLAGIIDGEGTVGHGKHSRRIEIVNTDINIIEATTQCLDVLGIGYSQRAFQPKNYMKDSTSTLKYMYVIYISQRVNLEKAYKLVPLQSFKKEKLGAVLSSYVREKPYMCAT